MTKRKRTMFRPPKGVWIKGYGMMDAEPGQIFDWPVIRYHALGPGCAIFLWLALAVILATVLQSVFPWWPR